MFACSLLLRFLWLGLFFVWFDLGFVGLLYGCLGVDSWVFCLCRCSLGSWFCGVDC